MDVLLTLAVLTLPAVISGLQTCSSGTETSSTQILLDVSTTQINTRGGMCSCRLTVSQTTQVDMFTVRWAVQCDTYMTIPKWSSSTQCTNDAVSTSPPQTHTVNTGEEIWILVVATKPGSRGLSGQLQFKVKQPSAQLNIACFEPNPNSSTTTTTTPVPTTTTTTVTSMMTTSIRPTTSTESATDNTRGIFAAGVATGAVLVLVAGGLYVVISRRQWWTSRRQKPDDIPISEAHPTYSGFTSGTEAPINTYDKIDRKPSKGPDNPYINVS